MALTIIKQCLWCSAPMATKRESKKICSTKCQSRMDYIRRRDWGWLTPVEFEKVINNWMADGSHVNPDHPINAVGNAMADVYRLATEVVKAENILLAVAAAAGNQPDKSLVEIIEEVRNTAQ